MMTRRSSQSRLVRYCQTESRTWNKPKAFAKGTLRVALVAALALVLVAPSGAAGDPGRSEQRVRAQSLASSAWPMFRHDASHRAESAYSGPKSPAQKWALSTGEWIRSSPAVGPDGTVYVGGDDGYLHAVRSNGSKKWSFETDDWVRSSPAVGSDGTVYIGSQDGKLYAVNANGTQKWAFETDNWVESSPALGSDGTVYVGSDDGKLYAINPNGTQKWSFATGEWVRSSPAVGPDGTVYVGSDDDKLYALNPNGTQKWSFQTGDWVRSSPAVGSDGTIYVGSDDGKLYAVNPNGTQKWSFQTGHWVRSSPAVGSDGSIYVGSDDGKLYALNAFGALRWTFATGDSIESCPAIGADGTVYVGSEDGKIYGISPAGAKKWSVATGDWVESSPAIGANGTLYVGSDDGKLRALADGVVALKKVVISASVGPTRVSYNGVVTVRATLKTASGALLKGRRLTLYSSSNSSDWKSVRTVGSSSGSYATTLRLTRKTYLRWRYAGDSVYAVGYSSAKSATSRAYLTPPNVPKRQSFNRSYSASGYLKPRHSDDYSSPVKCYWYSRKGGRWVLEGTTDAYVDDYNGYSRFTTSYSWYGSGSWTCRVRAYHSDGSHAATWSAWRYFSVH